MLRAFLATDYVFRCMCVQFHGSGHRLIKEMEVNNSRERFKDDVKRCRERRKMKVEEMMGKRRNIIKNMG